MVNIPEVLLGDSFQIAWFNATQNILEQGGERFNLIVQIRDIYAFNEFFHEEFREFSKANGILDPKHVAYTIFPYNLYEGAGSAQKLYDDYNENRGLFKRIQKRKRSWGSYFRRMSHYDNTQIPQNQLNNIVNSILKSKNLYKAAYTMVIQKPGKETIRHLGGPCLNYIALQIDPEEDSINILCVYRNHDFFEKAYGNYWGLCKLLGFLGDETGFKPKTITCISSHAYISNQKRKLLDFINKLK